MPDAPPVMAMTLSLKLVDILRKEEMGRRLEWMEDLGKIGFEGWRGIVDI